MWSSARSPGPTQVAAAMLTPASLIAVATSARAPGEFSMSMTRSTAISRCAVSLLAPLVARAEVAQHSVQNAAVLEVGDLVRRVDPDPHFEGDAVSAITAGRHLHRLRRAILEVSPVEGLLAGEPNGLDRVAITKLQGQPAHADTVGGVEARDA